MRKALTIITLLTLSVLLSRCDKKISDSSSVPFDNGIIQLRVGESAGLGWENYRIGFDSVLSDERISNCSGEPCGTAVIRLWILAPGTDTSFFDASIFGWQTTLDNGGCRTYSVAGLLITLIALDPYPQELRQIRYSSYTATIQVIALEPTGGFLDKVRLTNLPPDSIWLDPYRLDTVGVVGDTLTVSIFHGGGCETHYYVMYMSPSDFMESAPVQANLYLRHYNNADFCEALLHPELRLDLSLVKNRFQEYYTDTGTVILNIHNFPTQDPVMLKARYIF